MEPVSQHLLCRDISIISVFTVQVMKPAFIPDDLVLCVDGTGLTAVKSRYASQRNTVSLTSLFHLFYQYSDAGILMQSPFDVPGGKSGNNLCQKWPLTGRISHCKNSREFYMIISTAYAQSASSGFGLESLGGFFPIILMIAIVYFLMIRPQQRRHKEQRDMVEALDEGDEVITSGGLLGTITTVSENYVSLKIASGAEVYVQKTAIVGQLPRGTLSSL